MKENIKIYLIALTQLLLWVMGIALFLLFFGVGELIIVGLFMLVFWLFSSAAQDSVLTY